LRHDDRGTATVELVLMAPVVLAVLCLIVALGRITSAEAQVEGAARDAARAASLARSPSAAKQAATEAARTNLAGQHITCTRVSVVVDVSAFRPGGSVGVRVYCTASLSDLALAGVPGSKTLSATALAPLDRNRAVS
jgi:Flp pilus assembly protein TadG